MDWRPVEQAIVCHTEAEFSVERAERRAGGCINRCWVIEGGSRRFFVKLNRPGMSDLFAAETDSLQILSGTATVRIPEPVCYGEAVGYAYLVLEYLPLSPISQRGQGVLGEQLAIMHTVRQSCYGWRRDNWIGTTPQPNTKGGDWLVFYNL